MRSHADSIDLKVVVADKVDRDLVLWGDALIVGICVHTVAVLVLCDLDYLKDIRVWR